MTNANRTDFEIELIFIIINNLLIHLNRVKVNCQFEIDIPRHNIPFNNDKKIIKIATL